MTAPISATTSAPAPDYPACFPYTDAVHRRGDNVSFSAHLPDAYVAHLARTQAKVNIDVADMTDVRTVSPMIRDNDLKATTTMTITEAVLSRSNSHISLIGTATMIFTDDDGNPTHAMTFTDDDGQTRAVTAICEIVVNYALFADTAACSDFGQLLGLSPEQIQEMTNLTDQDSVITYLNAQCEKEPFVITNRKWKIADLI